MDEPPLFGANKGAPFGEGHRLNEAANDLRAKVRRALKRGVGCRLTPIMVEALNCMEGDGNWWNEQP